MSYFHLCAIILLSCFSSCSNNLDLVDPIVSLPVVYFQLNPEDSVFYLTLTKTFSGNNSAFNMASDARLVYYDSADIRLEGWVDEYKVTEIQFKRSDRIKFPGIFPETQGYCYEAENEIFTTQDESINSYRLVIRCQDLANPVVSRIPILPPTKVPNYYNNVIELYPDGYKYPPKGRSPVELKISQLNAEFSRVAYKQLICEFHYQEYDGTWIDRTVTFTVRKNTLVVEPILFANFFFQKVAAAIKPISDTITRRFTSLDLIFLSGDQFYKDYIEAYEHDGNQDIPLKGNIINGYGLFTMKRVAKYENMTLGQQSLDSLAEGRITKSLGFVRW